MSFSNAIVNNPDIVREVVRLYRTTEQPMKEIADHLRLSMSNTHEILKRNLPEEERKHLKSARYRNTKIGEKNPQFGKRPANFIGECSDGRGYLTALVDGKRYFVHRIVVAQMLGLHPSRLPENLAVHHIDGNRVNNNPDNLALVTRRGHINLHVLTDRRAALSA